MDLPLQVAQPLRILLDVGAPDHLADHILSISDVVYRYSLELSVTGTSFFWSPIYPSFGMTMT